MRCFFFTFSFPLHVLRLNNNIGIYLLLLILTNEGQQQHQIANTSWIHNWHRCSCPAHRNSTETVIGNVNFSFRLLLLHFFLIDFYYSIYEIRWYIFQMKITTFIWKLPFASHPAPPHTHILSVSDLCKSFYFLFK